MAQLTIYLDDQTLRRVADAARRERKSVSAWAREHLAESAFSPADWQAHVAENFGVIRDPSFDTPSPPTEPLRPVNLE